MDKQTIMALVVVVVIFLSNFIICFHSEIVAYENKLRAEIQSDRELK